jgi:hypothetical protein
VAPIALALGGAATARWRPMRSLSAAAAVALLAVAVGGCGSTIPVPDQGVVVLGCNTPGYCYRADCSCTWADAQPGGACTTKVVCSNPLDTSTCLCPLTVATQAPADLGGTVGLEPATVTVPVAVQCLETPQVCVGRGPFCGGVGARCFHTILSDLSVTPTCDQSGGDPPQLIPSGGIGPALEPHCAFVDDTCCPGAATVSDGGSTTD